MNVVGHGNVTVSKVLRIRLWKIAAQSFNGPTRTRRDAAEGLIFPHLPSPDSRRARV